MTIRFVHESASALVDYARVPSTFRVVSVVDLASLKQGRLRTTPHPTPNIKDYDAIPGNSPASWAAWLTRTDAVLIAGFDHGTRIGGAVIARDSADVTLLYGRPGEAVLWDMRVDPRYRQCGWGALLLVEAERWATTHGCHAVMVETQDNNVAACHLYHGAGCQVERIEPGVYPELPSETRLIWTKRLTAAASASRLTSA